MKHFAVAVLAIILECSGAVAALAQGVVTDPAVISGCLCQERGLEILKSRIDLAQEIFDQDRARVDALDQDLERARAGVDPTVQSQIEAVKAMNIEREQTYARTYDIDFPALQSMVEAYNKAARRYGGRCANRSFDAIGMARARETLSCPSVSEP